MAQNEPQSSNPDIEPEILEDEELPPGFYRVDEDGTLRTATNWQPVVDKIPWDKIDQLIENLSQRGSKERRINLHWMYLLSGLTILVAGGLAYQGVLEGQAIAAFLGAAIAYLLGRAVLQQGRGS